MTLAARIRTRLRRDYFHWHYVRAVRAVLGTPPLTRGVAPFAVLSMVHHRDVLSYLVAVKSFCRQINPSRVIVVCDPSIDAADRAIFRRHVPHIELRDAAEFQHPDIPRGGTWERLHALAQYSREAYVVQLDADTVTIDSVSEIRDAIFGANGFVLGEKTEQELATFAETRRIAQTHVPESGHAHVQTLAELAMGDAGLGTGRKYVRGCSGFTGFPQSATMCDALLDFSRRMHAQVGPRWSDWGTEQVSSNYLVANASGTSVLPFPKYGTPDAESPDTAFLHFIGPMRFVNRRYEKVSMNALDALRSAGG